MDLGKGGLDADSSQKVADLYTRKAVQTEAEVERLRTQLRSAQGRLADQRSSIAARWKAAFS